MMNGQVLCAERIYSTWLDKASVHVDESASDAAVHILTTRVTSLTIPIKIYLPMNFAFTNLFPHFLITGQTAQASVHVLYSMQPVKWHFLMADIFAWRSRKNTGVTNTIDAFVPFRCAVNEHGQYKSSGTGTLTLVVSYTCQSLRI